MLDLISRAFLTILNILERASQLKPKSDFKDLALVMALYLQWSQQYIEHQGYDEEDVFPCAPQIIRYAANHDIDLANSGVSGMQQLLEEKKEAVENQNPWPKDAIDRWGFKKAVSIYDRLLQAPLTDCYSLQSMSESSAEAVSLCGRRMGSSAGTSTTLRKCRRRCGNGTLSTEKTLLRTSLRKNCKRTASMVFVR